MRQLRLDAGLGQQNRHHMDTATAKLSRGRSTGRGVKEESSFLPVKICKIDVMKIGFVSSQTLQEHTQSASDCIVTEKGKILAM